MADTSGPCNFGISKLKGRDDYKNWSFSMRNYLRRQGLWSAVQGTDVENGKERREERALADLCLMVEPQNYQYVQDCKTSKEVWEKLQKTFETKGHWRYVYLVRAMCQAKYQDFSDMESYIAHITSLGQEMKSLGEEVKDKYLTAMIFQGLPAEFDSIVMTLCAGEAEMNLETVITKLLDDSQRRGVTSEEPNDRSALFSKKKLVSKNSNKTDDKPKMRCWRCHEIGHVSKDCPVKPKTSDGEGEKPKKTSAKKKEEKPKKPTETKDKNTFLCALTARRNDNVIVVDSGCEGHMSPDKKSLVNYKDSESDQGVVVGDNGRLRIAGSGDMTLESDSAINKMSDVLHVPGLSATLLSVSQCTDRGIDVLFTSRGCLFLDADDSEVKGTVLGTGTRVNGLYHLDGKPAAKTALVSSVDKYDLWHQRLIHAGSQKLKLLCNHSPDVDFQDVNSELCVACAMGKQCRQSFPRSISPKSSAVLDLVHADLAGPLPESYGGAKYVLTIVDDYSRFVTVYFLKNKSQTKDRVKEYIVKCETQYGKTVKIFRSDNGGEFVNKDLCDFFKSKGIIQQRTVRYTPEQNGVAEKQNRSSFDAARAMMFNAKCSNELWAEAVNTAVYVQNKLPHSGVNNAIPEELFTGKTVHYAHLRVFGCDAYVHVPKQIRTGKLSARSMGMIFVGYDTESKGYRMIDPASPHKVSVHHSVKFDERKFTMCSKSFTHLDQVVYCPVHDLIADNDVDTVPLDEAGNIENDENHGDFEEGNNLGNVGGRRYPLRDRKQKEFPDFVMYTASLYDDVVFEDHVEPVTVKEALSGKDADHWKQAMAEEYDSYVKNNVWELVEKPSGKTVVKCKWVFKIKRDCQGEIVKYKARLVAVGCSQKYGIDYEETYAPVVRYSTLRLFFSLAVKLDLQIHHVDISTAFLNGDLKEELYMSQPEGFSVDVGKVCRLKRAVYGLKQASKCWYEKVNHVLCNIGFVQSKYEPCVYICKKGNMIVIVALYVDDFFIFFNDVEQVCKLKTELSRNFSVKDLGEVSECLSMKVTRDGNNLKLGQKSYCEKLLSKFGMLDCVSCKTPMEAGLVLTKVKECAKEFPYQNAIGGLLYLSVCTRPDIAYAVNYLSQFNESHGKEHWNAVIRIFKYLKGTMDYGIVYSRTEDDVVGYCDASFANDLERRKSMSGYVFLSSGGAVSWESRKQEITALSSTEAEYICITHACKEAVFLKGFLFELYDRPGSVIIYNDNMSALKLSEKHGYHARTKHIDVRFHYVRELSQRGEVTLCHKSTQEMIADVLTKALATRSHVKCIDAMNVK